jgi:hypothetical protein
MLECNFALRATKPELFFILKPLEKSWKKHVVAWFKSFQLTATPHNFHPVSRGAIVLTLIYSNFSKSRHIYYINTLAEGWLAGRQGRQVLNTDFLQTRVGDKKT